MSEAESRLHTETVAIQADGTELDCYLAYDSGSSAPRPGVLVIHEWWGLNDYIRGRADMLATLGYAALAVDMYGDGQVAGDSDEAGRLMNGVLENLDQAESRFAAALAFLQGHAMVDGTKTAAIGYCFGGGVVLHAARLGMPLSGVVSYHGSLGSRHTPKPGEVRAKVLVCHGAEDVLVPAEHITELKEEMQSAGADLRFISYPGALHGFTNPEADANGEKYGLPLAYHADTDKASWKETQAFFKEIFA